MESDSESDGEERGGNLVGFLFGNVDKDMQLEEDYMDEVGCNYSSCSQHLWTLPNCTHLLFAHNSYYV